MGGPPDFILDATPVGPADPSDDNRIAQGEQKQNRWAASCVSGASGTRDQLKSEGPPTAMPSPWGRICLLRGPVPRSGRSLIPHPRNWGISQVAWGIRFAFLVGVGDKFCLPAHASVVCFGPQWSTETPTGTLRGGSAGSWIHLFCDTRRGLWPLDSGLWTRLGTASRHVRVPPTTRKATKITKS